jgi:hypothetical protein
MNTVVCAHGPSTTPNLGLKIDARLLPVTQPKGSLPTLQLPSGLSILSIALRLAAAGVATLPEQPVKGSRQILTQGNRKAIHTTSQNLGLPPAAASSALSGHRSANSTTEPAVDLHQTGMVRHSEGRGGSSSSVSA